MNNVAGPAPRNILKVLAKGWAVILGTAIIFGLGGLLVSMVQKPVYEASTTLFITSGGTVSPTAYDTVKASQERVGSYAQLLYSDAIMAPAVENAGLDWSLEQARQAVGVDINPQVVLITIYGRDNNPEIAQRFTSAIADSMIAAVSTLEVPGSGYEPTGKLTVVTPASVASAPVVPTTQVNVIVAAMLGLVVGALLVIVREARNKRVRNTEDAETALEAQPLATVPDSAELRDGQLIDLDGEPTPTVTSFRNLRSQMLLALQDRPNPIVMVTSARPGEGKSTVAVNVGAVLAKGEKSVVIVDANIDDPQVAQRVDAADTEAGLTDVLRGRVPLTDAVVRGVAGLPSLAVLGTGVKDADHPDDLFATPAFAQTMRDLAAEFDVVIIDAPALLANAGSDGIVPIADGVLMVIRSTIATTTDLVECRKRLRAVQARLLGFVLSEPQPETGRSRLKVNA